MSSIFWVNQHIKKWLNGNAANTIVFHQASDIFDLNSATVTSPLDPPALLSLISFSIQTKIRLNLPDSFTALYDFTVLLDHQVQYSRLSNFEAKYQTCG